MAGRGCSRQPTSEIEQLRRQVEFLTQRLTELEASRSAEESDDSDGSSENPFHGHAPCQEPPIRDDQRWETNFKLEIPEFHGNLQAEEFIDWLNTIERIFDLKDAPDDKKVKLVAVKLMGCASA
ncbi:hypothetical protein ACLB2K_016639 [Fragaria x ananassa]